MSKTAAQKAAAKFAIARQKANAVTKYQKAQQDVAKRTAKLRALRLAKEASDKQVAAEKAVANPPPKAKAKKAPKIPKRKTRSY